MHGAVSGGEIQPIDVPFTAAAIVATASHPLALKPMPQWFSGHPGHPAKLLIVI